MSRIHRVSALLSVLALVSAAPSVLQAARSSSGCRVEVVVDGRTAAEYNALGTRYIEATKGKDYAIRIHNPFDVRVAVALSVDGLNTIDARHTTAAAGRKWVIGPHETITISGWQTSMSQARRFFFTSEERSYAGRLGQPANIGVISAVFFRNGRPTSYRSRSARLAEPRAATRRRTHPLPRRRSGGRQGARRRRNRQRPTATSTRPPGSASAPGTRSRWCTSTSRSARPRRSTSATSIASNSSGSACCPTRRQTRWPAVRTPAGSTRASAPTSSRARVRSIAITWYPASFPSIPAVRPGAGCHPER